MVTLSKKSAKGSEVWDAPTLTENSAGQVAEVGIVAVRHVKYVKVPVVAVDQTVLVDVFALTATEYVPPSENKTEAANVMVLPDTVIRERLGPVTVSL